MQDVESHLRKVVGVNHALMDEDLQYEGEEIDPGISEMQSAKMKQLHEIRDEQIVLEALNAITEAANTDENLFPLILHAVRVYCSVG